MEAATTKLQATEQIERDPAQQSWGLQDIGSKAVRGAFALMLRQVWVHAANILGSILLARLLSPSEFGLYAIVLFFLTFSVTFGGTGLAANLIRQRADPANSEYRAVFAVQQVTVAALVVIIWFSSPYLNEVYHLPVQQVWIFRLIAISLLLTSMMVVPQVQMERHLAFGRLAIVEVVQAIVFNGAAVLFAWMGYAGYSFALALVLRALVGTVSAYSLNPWRIGWAWDWQYARKHLVFGFYYQAGQIINLAKDTISPFFVGIVMGTAAVGYINWASSLANYPVIALMLLNRLYLPAFAKLAHDPVKLKRAAEMVALLSGAVVFSASAVIYAFRREIIVTVFGAKWLVALPLFLPMILLNFLLVPMLVSMNVLNALGRSRAVFKMTILLAAGTWALGPALISFYGWQVWGWANLLVHLSTILLLAELRRSLKIDWLGALGRPLAITAATWIGAEIALAVGAPWILAMILALTTAIATGYLLLNRELLRMWRSLLAPKQLVPG
jgi:O-antigen/teichoic acid export membrane protein